VAKAAPIITSFDAGELSPLMEGRVDIAKFPNGCYKLENFLPLVQGPAVRRGGFRFVNPVKNAAGKSWLMRFQVSENISYMLEFGDSVIRFYANRGLLISGGNPVEVATPYTFADLTAADGTCRLHAVQSADTMYLFHLGYKTRKLVRTAANAFQMSEVDFTNGPFKKSNITKSSTVQANATTGTVTLTATAGIFQSGHIGSLFNLESLDLSAVKPWAVYQQVTVGDLRRVDARVYKCTNVGSGGTDPPVTGTLTPVHTEGRAWDGDGVEIANDQRGPIGVEWEYQHAGYGIVLISGVPDANHAIGTIISRLPDDVVTTPSWKWSHSLFSTVEGWPEHGAFWLERLVLARDRTLAGSVTGDFENFAAKDAGEVLADSSFVITLNARQINRIVWMVESEQLILGTNGDEWVVGPIQNNQAVGPGNIQARRRTSYGSRAVQPIEASGKTLFVQKSGRKIRDYEYDYGSDNFVSSDTTKLASHISRTGVVDMTYQQEPYSIIWCARSDGQLIGLTYDQELNRSDVYGWHPHPMINGAVEAVEAMPSPDGSSDDLWVIVRRVINGQVKRYVEWLEPPLSDEEDQVEAFYVDSGLSYQGSAISTVSGLDHLEGQTVDVLVDGATHPQRVVAAGKITLQRAGSIIHAGLPAPAKLATMRLNAGAADGTAQGKTQRVTNVVARVHRTLGGKLGPDENNLDELQFRRPSNAMDQAIPLYTGDTPPVPWKGGYSSTARIWYVNDQPLPSTIIALMPIVVTNDDR
jgi:hypothetical protein